MKLFHFNPNNWGSEFYVVSANRLSAYDALINSFKDGFDIEKHKEMFDIETIEDFEKWRYSDLDKLYDNGIDASIYFNIKSHYENYMEWKDVNPLNPDTFPDGYTLDCYEPNVVKESEIA